MNNMLYGAYTLLGGGLVMSCLPPFLIYSRLSGRYRENLKERLGCLSRRLVQGLPGSPRIWLHAVSLGEVKVAASIVKALGRIIPTCSVIVSTTTEHGRELARETFAEDIPVVYAPIDFIGSVRKALSRVHPDILVFLETEIWPVWLKEARRMGIKTALINGRISVRSIGGYLRFRPFFREVLKNIDAFSMISEEDAVRIKAMGADPGRIVANGNAKYDSLVGLTDPAMETQMRQLLNLETSDQVLVAGSTREGEEAMVLDAYKKIVRQFPNTVLIIVPRHIERTPVVRSIVVRRGFRCQLQSEFHSSGAKRTERVVILDTFGELFNVYSVSTIVFCGASLVPLGGQNPLEPAAWGKPVLYGPSMEDFLDAKALLEEVGGGMSVSTPDDLAEKVIWFLSHPDLLKTHGARAREAAGKNFDSAENHAKVIARLL